MSNLTNLTIDELDVYDIIRLYNETNPDNNESCWKQPTFWMMLVMLATQYLKPIAKGYMKKRQRDKDSSRRNTSPTISET